MCRPAGNCGDIVSRFERVGLKIIGTKWSSPIAKALPSPQEEIKAYFTAWLPYDANLGAREWASCCVSSAGNRCGAELVRKMVGETGAGARREPFAATTAYSFAYNSIGIPNLIHASGRCELPCSAALV